MLLNAILMAIIMGLLCRVMLRDRFQGMLLGTLLLATLPEYLAIELGSAPVINLYRVISLFMVVTVKKTNPQHTSFLAVPLSPNVLCLLAVDFTACITGFNFKSSMNQFIGQSLLPTLQFYVVYRSVTSRSDVLRLLKLLAWGFCVMAVYALFERWYNYNPGLLLSPDMWVYIAECKGVLGPYPHPILFGVGLAMGLPFVYFCLVRAADQKEKRLLWLGLGLCLCGIYWTFERGAWMVLLMVVCGGLLVSSAWRKVSLVLVVCLLGTMAVRPGVRESIMNKVNASFDDETIEGKSYEFRKELWQKAKREVSKSPLHLLLGYGPYSRRELDWTDDLTYNAGINAFHSWDNDYAARLLETGCLGVAMFGILSCRGILLAAKIVLNKGDPEARELSAAILLSMACVLVAMVFVKMFSPQILFLFWTELGLLAYLSSSVPQSVEALVEPGETLTGQGRNPCESTVGFAM